MNTQYVTIEGLANATSAKHRSPLEVPSSILALTISGEATLRSFKECTDDGKNRGLVSIYRECEHRLSAMSRNEKINVRLKMGKTGWQQEPVASRKWLLAGKSDLANQLAQLRKERDEAMRGWTLADMVSAEYTSTDHAFTCYLCPSLKGDKESGKRKVTASELNTAAHLYVASTTETRKAQVESRAFTEFAQAFGESRDTRMITLPTVKVAPVNRKPHVKPTSKTVAKIRQRPHNSKADRERLEAEIEEAGKLPFPSKPVNVIDAEQPAKVAKTTLKQRMIAINGIIVKRALTELASA